MTGIYIDANLLVLRVVGDVGRHLVRKHRRLTRFTSEDYDRLIKFTSRYGRLLVTPNTLTEASNLIAQHREPERSKFLEKLRSLIHEAKEIVVSSADAADSRVFVEMGLTDAALLECVSREQPLITVDLDLYLAASAKDYRAAFNFTHFHNT